MMVKKRKYWNNGSVFFEKDNPCLIKVIDLKDDGKDFSIDFSELLEEGNKEKIENRIKKMYEYASQNDVNIFIPFSFDKVNRNKKVKNIKEKDLLDMFMNESLADNIPVNVMFHESYKKSLMDLDLKKEVRAKLERLNKEKGIDPQLIKSYIAKRGL